MQRISCGKLSFRNRSSSRIFVTLLYHYIPSIIPIIRFHLNPDDNNYNILIDWEPTVAWKMNHLSCMISALTALTIASIIQEIIKIQNQINNKNNMRSHSSLLPMYVPSILFALLQLYGNMRLLPRYLQ